ncbi:MAG: hypothetical protein ACREMW_05505 [Gemmatimonadales bacterium]
MPHYAAALIAAGDPTLRYLALAKVRDTAGRTLADVMENRVVGIVGNYIACPLRSLDALPEELRGGFARTIATRPPDEIVVTVPVPGLWLSQQHAPVESGAETPAVTQVVPDEEGRDRRVGRGWRAGRGGGSPPTADTA